MGLPTHAGHSLLRHSVCAAQRNEAPSGGEDAASTAGQETGATARPSCRGKCGSTLSLRLVKLGTAYWHRKEPFPLNLSSQDLLILLVYFVVAVVIGYALRKSVRTPRDFSQAGRRLPAWICALAFIGAGLGAPEVLGMGAAGARYGLHAALFGGVGATLAIVFAGLLMMPLYYGSNVRSVAEFLGARFDRKTRTLNASLFAAMTVLTSGISLCVLARAFVALHLFEGIFRAFGWPREGIFSAVVVVSAAIVLVYVLLSGLAGAILNQTVQFVLLVGGLLPVVLMGLRSIGGWGGLKASLQEATLNGWPGAAHAGGMETGMGIGLGVLLGAAFWCADFRVLQIAMAAKSVESARRVPLLAAIPMAFLPLLLILPGAIAVGLPTPRTTTVTRIENGAIIHTITVVRPEVEAGNGLVPARVDPATRKPMVSTNGETLLDYELATPTMVLHFLPTGILGLGLAALLASLMSSLAANLMACSTVFTVDLYGLLNRKNLSDQQTLAAGRWAALAGIVLSLGTAFAAARLNGILGALLLLFSVVGVPLFAVVLLGMFWKRATGHGAFAGLISGAIAALLHHGLTLPAGAEPGSLGGWIAVLHRYPGGIAQSFWTAILAFSASLIVTLAVSLSTKPPGEAELKGLVYSLTPKAKPAKHWWQRSGVLAAGVLLLAFAVTAFIAR